MKKLYAPWRADYSKNIAHSKDENASEDECTFCTRMKENNDEENYIIKRYPSCVIFLNRYPYNAGHLLILPNKHHASLDQLNTKERNEIMECINTSVTILKKELQAEGINVGLNLGKAAGAGIPSHLHVHVLPRWAGDTNFLPTLADTKQISFDMNKIYAMLKEAFDQE